MNAALRDVDLRSSPGFPYMRLGRTNEDVLGLHRSLVVDLVVHRLMILQEFPAEFIRSLSSDALVSCGFCDPIRVFVKNELHSREKVAQGRMRLIMSVSLVDQLVERVINSAQNKLEILSWQHIPSKPGMGLDDESLASLERQIKSMKNPLSSDVSGFDWSVSQEWLDFDARVRQQLTCEPFDLHLKRSWCLGNSLLVFSDGVVWKQTLPGVQKSGSYNTSSTNSRIRAALAREVAARVDGVGACIAMGDDAVEDSAIQELAPIYLEYGFRLKEVSRDIEFCAYAFNLKGGFEPVRWHKMLANLLWTQPRNSEHANELLCALRYELRHSPHSQRAECVIAAVNWGGGN